LNLLEVILCVTFEVVITRTINLSIHGDG